MAERQERISITPSKRQHAKTFRILVLYMVKNFCQKLNLLRTRSAEKRIIDNEHIAAILVSQRSNFLDDLSTKMQCEFSPVNAAGIHEAVKRIFCKGDGC